MRTPYLWLALCLSACASGTQTFRTIDGPLVVAVDPRSGKPAAAKDEQAEVVAASLVYLAMPDKTPRVWWQYSFAMAFSDDRPTSIHVFDVTSNPPRVDLVVKRPRLKDGTWRGESPPLPMSQEDFELIMAGNGLSQVFRLTVMYESGKTSVLHQPVAYTGKSLQHMLYGVSEMLPRTKQ